MKSKRYTEIINNSSQASEKNTTNEGDKRLPRRLSVPGFLLKEEIGLGDALKHVSHKVRFRPCSGCQRRAARLNRKLIFSPRRSK